MFCCPVAVTPVTLSIVFITCSDHMTKCGSFRNWPSLLLPPLRPSLTWVTLFYILDDWKWNCGTPQIVPSKLSRGFVVLWSATPQAYRGPGRMVSLSPTKRLQLQTCCFHGSQKWIKAQNFIILNAIFIHWPFVLLTFQERQMSVTVAEKVSVSWTNL